jgi:polyhydroxyalkanoate synthesis regulator phasin
MAAPNRQKEAADALRAAVDGAVQATVGQASASRERAQERAQDLVDEVAQAAGRMRDVLDDLRLATREDIRDISDRLGSLERRISALETKPAPKPKAAAKPRAAAKPKAKPAVKRTKPAAGK